MIAPDIIYEFIEQANKNLTLLHHLDRSYSQTLVTISSIREEARESPFAESIKILISWIYKISAKIRSHIERFEIHREHLISWYKNSLLGAEDW